MELVQIYLTKKNYNYYRFPRIFQFVALTSVCSLLDLDADPDPQPWFSLTDEGATLIATIHASYVG